jgi:ribosomal protein L23
VNFVVKVVKVNTCRFTVKKRVGKYIGGNHNIKKQLTSEGDVITFVTEN